MLCPNPNTTVDRTKCAIKNSKLEKSVDLKDIYPNGAINIAFNTSNFVIDLCDKDSLSAAIDYRYAKVTVQFNETSDGRCVTKDGESQFNSKPDLPKIDHHIFPAVLSVLLDLVCDENETKSSIAKVSGNFF